MTTETEMEPIRIPNEMIHSTFIAIKHCTTGPQEACALLNALLYHLYCLEFQGTFETFLAQQTLTLTQLHKDSQDAPTN